jgi:predicted nucleotide-binding protein
LKSKKETVPYHVRVSTFGEMRDELKWDLDEATLERQFLRPYREGHNITVNGRTIPLDRIDRLQVLYTDDSLGRWPGAGLDVTDEVIQGSPGTATVPKPATEEAKASSAARDPRRVFLVYGRWHEAVEAMREFLASLDLQAIEWEKAVQATGKASPHITDILDAGFELAYAAVVLMTPDDVACLHPDLRSSSEPPERLTGQPRPNVLFEAGMAWRQFADRTLLVEFGQLRGFSDLAGVYVVRFDGSVQTRRAVASRLRTIGCAVDDTGDRWLTAGRFPPALRAVTAADLGFEVTETIEARGVAEPTDALKGIPLRWILLARLAAMQREQASSSHVLTLDVTGIATQAGAEVTDVRGVLSELVTEGLVEGYAETFGRTAVDGACRITASGLRRLRAEA